MVLFPPFNDRYYDDSSAVLWILLDTPEVLKGSSSAPGIDLGDSLSTQW